LLGLSPRRHCPCEREISQREISLCPRLARPASPFDFAQDFAGHRPARLADVAAAIGRVTFPRIGALTKNPTIFNVSENIFSATIKK